MAFSVRDINTVLKAYGGVSKKPYFAVRMTPPKFISSEYARDFEFLCMSASLPGIHFDTIPVRPKGYGTSELRPYNTNVNTFNCDLLVDVQGKAFEFLHNWVGNINNFNIDPTVASNQTGLNYYEFAYPEEYETIITVTALDNYVPASGESQTTVVEYKLHQAFPVTIGDIQVGWNNDNDYNVLPVTFAYNMWSSKTLPYSNMANEQSANLRSLRNNLEAVTPIYNEPDNTP